MTIGADQTFGGGAELKDGSLLLMTSGSLGTNKNLKVTGNSSLGGVSSALSGLSLASGVSLNVSAMDDNTGLILNGSMTLKGASSITGNIQIGGGKSLIVEALPGAGASVLTVAGNLKLDGSLLFSSPLTSWVSGMTYDIISATSVSGSLSNPGDYFVLTDSVCGKWMQSGNKLQFGTYAIETISWAGTGNSVWTLDGASADSPWENQTVYTNANKVVFGDIAGQMSQTVSLSGTVTPMLSILVNANSTNYIWSGSGKLGGAAVLEKSGSGSLAINTNNDGYAGKVILKGGVLEVGNNNAIGSSTLTFNGGILKYGAGVTKDFSGQMSTRTEGNDNTIRVDTNSNDVVWSAVDRASYAYEKLGEGTLTLKTLSTNNYAGSMTISKGALKFDSSAGNITISGVISGSGKLIKSGTSNFFITGNSNTFTGILELNGGATVIGGNNADGGTGSLANLGATSTIIVNKGASFRINLGGAGRTFAFSSIYVKSGGELGNVDGDSTWDGPLHFNVDTINADGSASYLQGGAVTLMQHFAKRVIISGIVAGAGDVNWKTGALDTGNWHTFALTNTGNTFSGSYNIDTVYNARLELATADTATGGVASKASVSLISSTSQLNLSGGAANSVFSLVNLDTSTGSLVYATNGAKKLILNDNKNNTIAGSFGDATNLLSLEKTGTGKLALTGTVVAGTIKASGGVLQLGGAAAYTLTASSVTIGSGSGLDIGGTGTISTLSFSGNLALDNGSRLFMDIGAAKTSDKLVYTGANALSGGHQIEINLSGAAELDEYTLIDSTTAFASDFNVTWTSAVRGLNGTLTRTNNQIKFNLTALGGAGSLVWAGTDGSHIWETRGASNWTGETDSKFYANDNVLFTDAAANKNVELRGNVSPGSIVVNSSGNYVFSSSNGGGIVGSASLTKEGSGKLTLNTDNSGWSGAINLKAGSIEFGRRGLGTGTLTMEGGTQLVWRSFNADAVKNLVANSGSIELNTGSNEINGTQVVSGAYTAVKKTGTGSISLSLLGAGKTLTVAQGSVTLINSAANAAAAYIIESGGTLNLTEAASGSLTLNGGTLNFGSVSNVYIGCPNITFNDKSLITGASGSQWRLEGSTLTTVTVNKAASGSLINVGTITLTRYTTSQLFHVEDGNEKFDLVIASNFSGQEGQEIFTKTGEGTMLLNGTSAGVSLRMKIDAGIVQIGNATNGNDNGTWTGGIEVGASGRLVIDKTTSLSFATQSGRILAGSGAIDIINTGKVILTNGAHTYAGTINLTKGGVLDISGSAMTADTKIQIDKGSLENMGAYLGSISVKQTDADIIRLGGASGSSLKSVSGTTAKDGSDKATTILGVSGNVVLSGGTSFGVSSDMVGIDATGTGQAITIGNSGTLTIDGALSLTLTDKAVQSILSGRNGDKVVSINLTNGALSLTNTTFSFNTPYNILSNMFTYKNTQGGALVLDMKDPAKSGWIIVDQGETVTIDDKTIAGSASGIIDGASGIHNNGSIVINVTGTKTISLNNLEGSRSDNGAVISTGTNSGLTLSLVNTGNVTSGLYHGSITGSAAIEKNGLAGTTYDLIIGGDVSTSKLTVNNGSLTIGGKLNSSGATTVNDGTSLVLSGKGSLLQGGLVLNGSGLFKLADGAAASVSTIAANPGSIITPGIELGNGSVLTLTATGSLDTLIGGTGGTLAVSGQGTTLTVGANGDIGTGTSLSVDSQTKVIVSGSKNAAGLSGKGTLEITGELELHDATKTFEGSLEGNGSLIHKGKGVQTINMAGNAGMKLVQNGEGRLVLNYNGRSEWGTLEASQGVLQIGNSVDASEFVLQGTATLIIGNKLENDIYVNRAKLSSDITTLGGGSLIHFGGISSGTVDNVSFAAGQVTHTGGGTTGVELGSVGEWTESEYKISLISGEGINTGDYEAILRGSLANLGYELKELIYEGSVLKAVVTTSGKNGFLRFANSHNTTQAAESFWQARKDIEGKEPGVLSKIIEQLRDANSGQEGDLTAEQAQRALASYAGSSLTSLLSSQRSGLVQQVKWIRNRTAQMGVNPGMVNENMPYVNAWVQGNAGYHKVSASGDEAGYTMNSWGGTAGVDIDINETWTVGGAFTADYAKLTTEAFDSARGHNDAYYANLFARMQKNNWSHTLIVTGGWNDVDLKRNVLIGSDSYNTRGDTSGVSFGAYYEGTYDIALNDAKTSIIQPLINASIYHSSLDSYSETGMEDASLSVKDMNATYGTMGVGARVTGIVGTNILGRGALGEIRAQIVQDYGDRTNEVRVNPLAAPNAGMKILGSKVGSTGFQIGAGLAVPVAERSCIYADVDADFRSKATVVTGNLGYRYNF